MDTGLKKKNALVLSSSRGLGLGIAEALADEGANVLLTGRSEDRLKENVLRINKKGQGKAEYACIDLNDRESVSVLERNVREVFGGADILINNTGGPPPGKMVDADINTLPGQIEAMVTRIIQITDMIIPHMRAQQWGRIVTIGSSGLIQPIPNLALSNLIRASLVGWSKSLSNDLGPEGITVNMLLPGRIDTERVGEIDEAAAKRTGTSVDAVQKASMATIPLARYGTVSEFSAVATFLVSEAASYVTGSQIRCDGGLIRSV
ncbi:MAG: SDR family oxidoreductase [Paracoccaceae bacterium]